MLLQNLLRIGLKGDRKTDDVKGGIEMILFGPEDTNTLVKFKTMMKSELQVKVELSKMVDDRDYVMQMLLRGKDDGSLQLASLANELIDKIHSDD